MTFTKATRRDLLIGATMASLAAAPAIAGAKRAAPRKAAQPGPADKLGEALFADSKSPALTIAVARANGVAWSAAYGLSNVELNVRASTDHLFRLGSVSKVLTATLVAKLVSRGLLDLDLPISKWLPDLPSQHRQTTLRQLLTHRGGIRHYVARDYDLNGPGGPIYMRHYPTNQDILNLFINDPLIGPVGGPVRYTSYGFTLASIVIEQAAGRNFVELIKTEIGNSFGLKILLEDNPFALIPQRATGYLNEMDRKMLYGMLPETAQPRLTNGIANAPITNPAYCWAGAGFLMSATDAALFGAALLDKPGSAISAAERALLFTPMTEADKSSPPLGLAWRIDKDAKGRLRWHHAGATPGGRFSLVIYPEQQLSIAMAANLMTAPGDVLKPSAALADVFA